MTTSAKFMESLPGPHSPQASISSDPEVKSALKEFATTFVIGLIAATVFTIWVRR